MTLCELETPVQEIFDQIENQLAKPRPAHLSNERSYCCRLPSRGTDSNNIVESAPLLDNENISATKTRQSTFFA